MTVNYSSMAVTALIKDLNYRASAISAIRKVGSAATHLLSPLALSPLVPSPFSVSLCPPFFLYHFPVMPQSFLSFLFFHSSLSTYLIIHFFIISSLPPFLLLSFLPPLLPSSLPPSLLSSSFLTSFLLPHFLPFSPPPPLPPVPPSLLLPFDANNLGIFYMLYYLCLVPNGSGVIYGDNEALLREDNSHQRNIRTVIVNMSGRRRAGAG